MTMRFIPHLATLMLALALTGCTLEEAKTTPSPAAPTAPVAEAPAVAPTAETPPVTADSTAPAAPEGKMPGPPPMAGGPMMGGPMAGQAAPNAPLTPNAEMDKKIVDAEKSGDKKAIAAAYAARGTFRMNDAAAGAKVKYKAALSDYRKALAADPANAEAKDNKAMIESIYKSMGRPVPGE